ncbi:MAG: winged helix-turn-helix transcriptional regulator [Alphaproteobacteria bacterium]|nr:winged helix-turn-helix transcriptional regulator [Alphaproteobacteria bacterium]
MARSTPDTLLTAEERASELADLFRLLGDASRLRIVLACLDGPISVTEIAERLGLSASLVSHHLRLLRAARIVRSQRSGKSILYEGADDHVRCVIADMAEHMREPADDEV